MNSLKLSLLLLKRDIKNFSFYLISSIISFTILFGVFNIMYDENIVANLDNAQFVVLSQANVIVVAIVIAIGYYSNAFFMDRRKKEIGIQLISGLSLSGLAFATAVINIIISGVSMLLGLAIGFVISPLINNVLYSFIGIEASFAISANGLSSAFGMIFINILLLGLLNVGLGYRTEICDLVRSKSGTYKTKKKGIGSMILSVLTIITSAISLFLILTTSDFNVVPVFGIVGSVSFFFLIFKGLPSIFAKLGHDTVNKVNIIVFKNTKLNIEKNLASLICILTISGFLCYSLGEYSINPYSSLASTGVALLLIILFIICNFYAFSALAHAKSRNFVILSSLGYSEKEKDAIIFKETILFIFCICILPLVLVAAAIIKLCILNVLSINLAIFIFCVFALAILVSYVGSYLIYKKTIRGEF